MHRRIIYEHDSHMLHLCRSPGAKSRRNRPKGRQMHKSSERVQQRKTCQGDTKHSVKKCCWRAKGEVAEFASTVGGPQQIVIDRTLKQARSGGRASWTLFASRALAVHSSISRDSKS